MKCQNAGLKYFLDVLFPRLYPGTQPENRLEYLGRMDISDMNRWLQQRPKSQTDRFGAKMLDLATGRNDKKLDWNSPFAKEFRIILFYIAFLCREHPSHRFLHKIHPRLQSIMATKTQIVRILNTQKLNRHAKEFLAFCWQSDKSILKSLTEGIRDTKNNACLVKHVEKLKLSDG